MTNIICIDTHVAIWGIKNQCEPHDIDKLERARLFFEELDKKKIQVLIPTIVIAEILVKEPFEKQVVFVDTISKNFLVGNLDIPVAMEYARLLRKNEGATIDTLEQDKIRKDKMKFDHVVIATAIIHGANCIYSYDDGLKKFASGIIEVKEIPAIMQQSDLFDPYKLADES
jgi:predicted nucleic acid-binding protein